MKNERYAKTKWGNVGETEWAQVVGTAALTRTRPARKHQQQNTERRRKTLARAYPFGELLMQQRAFIAAHVSAHHVNVHEHLGGAETVAAMNQSRGRGRVAVADIDTGGAFGHCAANECCLGRNGGGRPDRGGGR